MQQSFIINCKAGFLKKVQHIYNNNIIDINYNNNEAIYGAIYNGHMHIAEWLYSLDSTIDIEKIINENNLDKLKMYFFNNKLIIKIINEKFINALQNLNFKVAQYYYDFDNIDLNSDVYDKIFIDALISNYHLDIAKFLISKKYNPSIDILNFVINKLLSSYCNSSYYYNNIYNLEYIYYIYSIDNNLKIISNEKIFRLALLSGHLKLTNILISTGFKPSIVFLNHLFDLTCSYYHSDLTIPQYLYSLDNNIDIRQDNDRIFKSCSEEKRIWLSTLCNDYVYHDNNWYIINPLKRLFINKQYNEIAEYLKIQKNDFKINNENICAICFSENYNFLTSCNHSFCLECFLVWYIGYDKKSCSYCMNLIDIEKCYYKN
jgi:hypothetical protein